MPFLSDYPCSDLSSKMAEKQNLKKIYSCIVALDEVTGEQHDSVLKLKVDSSHDWHLWKGVH